MVPRAIKLFPFWRTTFLGEEILFAHPLCKPLTQKQKGLAIQLGANVCQPGLFNPEPIQRLLLQNPESFPLPLLPPFLPLMPWFFDRLLQLTLSKDAVFQQTQAVKETFPALFTRTFRQQKALQQLLQELEEKQLPLLLFKGAVLSTRYPNPLLRPSSDLDVLVQQKNLSALEKHLNTTGWNCRKRSTYSQLWVNPADVHLDVHLISTTVGERIWKESIPFGSETYRENTIHRQPTQEAHFALLALHSSGQFYKKLWRDFLDVQHLPALNDLLLDQTLPSRYSNGNSQKHDSLEAFTFLMRALLLVQKQKLSQDNLNKFKLSPLFCHYWSLLVSPFPQALMEEMQLLARYPGLLGELLLATRSILETHGICPKNTNQDFWITHNCRKTHYYRIQMRSYLGNLDRKRHFLGKMIHSQHYKLSERYL